MNYDCWKTTPPDDRDPSEAAVSEAMSRMIDDMDAIDLLGVEGVEAVVSRVYARQLAAFAAEAGLDVDEAAPEFFWGKTAEDVMAPHPEIQEAVYLALGRQAMEEAMEAGDSGDDYFEDR